MRTAFFHKDNYCLWEILPLAAKEFCLKEMDKNGWTVGNEQDFELHKRQAVQPHGEINDNWKLPCVSWANKACSINCFLSNFLGSYCT